MIFEQSVLHKLNMKTSQSRDSDVSGTNCDVIKENLASLSRSDDVIVTYTKIHSRHTSISYNSCGVDERFSLTDAGRQYTADMLVFFAVNVKSSLESYIINCR